jgi:hypothetical protein
VFDGRMLGLNGQVVTYPQWFFLLIKNAQRRLNRIAKEEKREPVRIIERDGSGLWRVLPEVKRQRPMPDLPPFWYFFRCLVISSSSRPLDIRMAQRRKIESPPSVNPRYGYFYVYPMAYFYLLTNPIVRSETGRVCIQQ